MVEVASRGQAAPDQRATLDQMKQDGTKLLGPAHQIHTAALLLGYCIASGGMMISNKLSLVVLPPLSLVGIQAFVAVIVMLFFDVKLGSFADVKRFMVVPGFFCGMLAFSALTLRYNSMTFLIVFRSCTPIVSLAMEHCVFEKARKVSTLMAVSLLGAVGGAIIYIWADFRCGDMTWMVVLFCTINMFMASGDRIANRWVVHERPVAMNNEGMVLINNALTCIFCMSLAYRLGEYQHVQEAYAHMTVRQATVIFISCMTGALLGCAAFAVQRRITATDMQVLINANKAAVILIEVLFMGKVLTGLPLCGCLVALGSGAMYSYAVTSDRPKGEAKPLLPGKEEAKPGP